VSAIDRTSPERSAAARDESKIRLTCVRCRRGYPWSLTLICPDCGGLIDIDYDLSRATIAPEGPPMHRYFDLLPLASRDNVIDGGEGNTPCVHARELGRAIGLDNLYVKMEGANPTRTTKDRQGTQAVATFRDLGVSHFVTSSTGNSCTALARIVARYPDMKMSAFVGDEFLERLNWASAPNVTVYWLPNGSFVDAHAAARWFSEREGIAAERGFFFFGKREALKVAYLEAVEQVRRPIEAYVQGVSSAMGVYATWKGALQLQALGRIAKPPRLICVQEETCDPMVRAWRRGGATMTDADVVTMPRGLSKATLRGDARGVYTYVRDAVIESGGTFLTVSQDAMREMRALLVETEGIDACYTSAMTVAAAAALRREGQFNRDTTILLNLTGADRIGMPHARADFIVEKDGAGGFRIAPAGESEAAGSGARGSGDAIHTGVAAQSFDEARVDEAIDDHLARVLAVVQRIAAPAGDARLSPETRLVGGGLGLDSVSMLELALALESDFGCALGEAELRPPHTESVRSIAEMLRAKLPAAGAARPHDRG
jgi:threonine synthase